MGKLNKKIILGISFILIVIVMSWTTLYILSERKIISVSATEISPIKKTNVNEISKIGLVGDSWVSDNKLDYQIEETLNSLNVQVDIISSGHPGAKSKSILKNLISDETNENSSNHILTDNDIQYVIVIAGVNDTAGHIGSDFYSNHMIEIVKLLNINGKIPLILEAPNYGISEKEKFKSSLKHNFYKVLFDDNKTDVIDEYREELIDVLYGTELNYEIVKFPSNIKYYEQDVNLYKDQFHLNKDGNLILGEYLGNQIYQLTSQ